jgi:serine/threonine protein kinase
MTEKRCPPPEQLKAYLAGLLEPEGYDSLSKHLLDCQDCEQTIIALEADPDTLVEILKQPHAPEPSELPASAPKSPADSLIDLQNASARNGIPKQIGQYELLSLLGSGGMGAVYLARHKSLDKKVALKLLPAFPSQKAEFVARFQREMRAAGKLDAPAIVRTTDAGEHDGIHYLVMDAIDGLNLSNIARAEGKLAVADACELVRQAAMGLAHAHENGIVHRDVKPSNLMLDCSGQVRILDFGLAQMSFWESGSAEITTVGQLMGTLDYMAPEQAERGGAVDYRADLYSLGSTLFRLLTGRAPLAAAPNLTPLEKLRLLATHKPPRLRSLRPDAPKELGEIVDAMLSRDPSQRPASAIHAAELLEPFTTDADLVGLLKRAKENPIPDESNLMWNPLWQRDLKDKEVVPKLASNRSRFGGWGTWIAAACLGCLILGGILFVIETNKGQLVIDSEANVQVRLVSVDDSGSKTDIDDLQIMPGTKATRLRSGKYEIILEGASDSFVVHNGSFSIRNGEVVVATVKKKGSATAGDKPILEAVQENPSDPRLDGIVYEGKSLRKLLETIRYERSISELEKALSALNGIAEPSVDDLVSTPLTDLMLRAPTLFRHSAYMLYRCNPDRFVERLADALDSNPEIVESSDILSSLPRALDFFRSTVKQPFERLYPYLERSLQPTEPYQRLSVAFQLRNLVCDSERRRIPHDVQAKILGILCSTEGLSNEIFWFRVISPFGETFYPQEPFGELLANEVTQRALATLSGPESSKEETALALLILRKMIEDGHGLSEKQTVTLTECITPLLQIPTKPLPVVDVYSFPEDCFLPIWSQGVVSASANVVHTKSNGQKQRNVRIDHSILALNLIESAKIKEQMKPQLTRLLDELNATRLFDQTLGRITNQQSLIPWESIAADSVEDKHYLLLRQLIYGQVATMLGQDKKEIFARFETKQKVDFDFEIQPLVQQLRKGNLNVLPQLAKISAESNDIGILESTFLEKADINYVRSKRGPIHIILLAKALGDQLPASLVRILSQVDGETRNEILRVIVDQYQIGSMAKEIGIHNLQAVEEALQWCDRQLSSQSEIMSNPDLLPLMEWLIAMLVQTAESSLECQQLIVDRLTTYSGLTTDGFWLRAPVDNPFASSRIAKRAEGTSRKFSQPMRLAILRKAISVLGEDKAVSDKLRCHARITLLHNFEDAKLLRPPEQEAILKSVWQKLDRVVTDPQLQLAPVKIDGDFQRIVMSELQTSELPAGSVYRHSCSELVNLADKGYGNEMSLAFGFILKHLEDGKSAVSDPVLQPIQKLHKYCEAVLSQNENYMSLYYMSRYNEIDTRSQQLQESQKVALWNTQLIFIQTGVLLGKDFDKLVGYTYNLAVAEIRRKARLIQPRDTLSFYLQPTSGETPEPPVIQAGSRTPVVGFPIIVDEGGMIDLPSIGKIDTTDCDLDMLKTKIEEQISKLRGITMADTTRFHLSFLLRHNESLELRNVTGGQTNAKQ